MSNIESTEAGNWLKHLTDAELAYWEAKPQSEKGWWDTNTKPEDRPQILRTEISAKATHERFLRLPLSTREAITKRLETEADAARIRLRRRGYGIAEQASPIETVAECCRRCVDSWCERREIRCLAYLLPAYVSPLAHTDQLQGLLSALKDVKGLCRERLTKDELTWVIEAYNTLEDILTRV